MQMPVMTWSVSQVQHLLKQLDLEHHCTRFEAEEIDGECLCSLDTEDLTEVGFSVWGEKQRISLAIERLLNQRSVVPVSGPAAWTVQQVALHLQARGLPVSAQKCVEHAVTGDVLLGLTKEHIRDALAVPTMGEKKGLARAVRELAAQWDEPPSSPPSSPPSPPPSSPPPSLPSSPPPSPSLLQLADHSAALQLSEVHNDQAATEPSATQPALQVMSSLATPHGHWSCAECTFRNPPDYLACEICGSTRRTAPILPDETSLCEPPVVRDENGTQDGRIDDDGFETVKYKRRFQPQIDLHQLTVAQALTKVEHQVLLCRERGQDKLKIITGRGNNSPGGAPKIKPAVEAWLLKNGYTCIYRPRELGGLVEVDTRALS